MSKLFFLVYMTLGVSLLGLGRNAYASTLFAPDSDTALLLNWFQQRRVS